MPELGIAFLEHTGTDGLRCTHGLASESPVFRDRSLTATIRLCIPEGSERREQQDFPVTQSTRRQEGIRVASFIHRGLRACCGHSPTAVWIRLRGFKCPYIAQLKAACKGSLGREEQSQSQCSRLHIPEYDACFQDHWLSPPPKPLGSSVISIQEHLKFGEMKRVGLLAKKST